MIKGLGLDASEKNGETLGINWVNELGKERNTEIKTRSHWEEEGRDKSDMRDLV